MHVFFFVSHDSPFSSADDACLQGRVWRNLFSPCGRVSSAGESTVVERHHNGHHNTPHGVGMNSRSEALCAAQMMGLEGKALNLFIRAGARARHEARVEKAHATALDWANGDSRRALSACLLDAIGIGGPFGAGGWGCSTTRHPAFASCGSGRKNAKDGGAWTAAIEEAANKFHSEMGWMGLSLNREGQLVLRDIHGVSHPIETLEVERPWINALARRIVLAAAKGEPMDPQALKGASEVLNEEQEAPREPSGLSHGEAQTLKADQAMMARVPPTWVDRTNDEIVRIEGFEDA